MDYTAEQIEGAFNKMPPALKKAISVLKIADIMQTLGKRHGLHMDKISEMGGYVHLVLVGLLPAGELSANFKDSLSLPGIELNELIQEINDLILGPVRDKFRELETLSAEEETEAKEAAPEMIAPVKPLAPSGPNSEEILKTTGIDVLGTSPAPSTSVINVATQKLANSFRMPKQETDLSLVKPTSPSPAGSESPAPSPATKIDPYKEKV